MLHNLYAIYGSEDLDEVVEDGLAPVEDVIEMPTTSEEVEEMAAEKQAEEAVEEVEDQAQEELEPVVEAVAETEDAVEQAVEIVEAIDGEVIDPITTEEVVVDGVERLDGLMSGAYNAAAMKCIYSQMQRVAPKLGVDLNSHCSLDGTESFNDVHSIRHQIIAGKEGLISGIKRMGSKTWDMIKRVMSSIYNFFIRLFTGKKDVGVYYQATMKRVSEGTVKSQARVGDWESHIEPELPNKSLEAWLNIDSDVSDYIGDMISSGKKLEGSIRSGKPFDHKGWFMKLITLPGKLFKRSPKGAYKDNASVFNIGGMAVSISVMESNRREVKFAKLKVSVQRNPSYRARRGEVFNVKTSISELSNGLKQIGRYLTNKTNEGYARDFSPSAINQVISALQARVQVPDQAQEESQTSAYLACLKANYTNIGALAAGICPVVMKGVTCYMNYANAVITKTK